ncbi:MAG: DpnD/PcfM family protein [Saprospiraceae bacterium]
MKKVFKVLITEVLQREVEVMSKGENEAIKIVKDQYYDEEIILDADDHIDTDFKIEQS